MALSVSDVAQRGIQSGMSKGDFFSNPFEALQEMADALEEKTTSVVDAIKNRTTMKNAILGADGGQGDTIGQQLRKAGFPSAVTEGVSQTQNKADEVFRELQGEAKEFVGSNLEHLKEFVEEKSGMAIGEGFIEPASALEGFLTAGDDNLVVLIKDFIGTKDVVSPSGETLIKAFGEDDLKELGIDLGKKLIQEGISIVNGSDGDKIINAIDKNSDGKVTATELRGVSTNTEDLEELMGINPAIAKLITDPSFVSRIIKRRNVPSIYGDNFGKQHNQVDLVEQGVGLDHETANQFNVGFEGSSTGK